MPFKIGHNEQRIRSVELGEEVDVIKRDQVGKDRVNPKMQAVSGWEENTCRQQAGAVNPRGRET